MVDGMKQSNNTSRFARCETEVAMGESNLEINGFLPNEEGFS